ncbi:MAG: oxygen-independent coproporphyrinogen III oxidase [Candidatus Omnitrophota bacterium]
MSLSIEKSTIQKFDTPGPRYTSYPTAPEWDKTFDPQVYIQKLKEFGRSQKSLSIYVHIPFCQSLCYFCACTVAIRKQEDKFGDEYLDYLCKEVDLVRAAIGRRAAVKQFHLGGGTPTFLTEKQLERLYHKIAENFLIEKDAEISIEVDPRTIDESKVKKLRQLGFNRMSMGVQDFNEEVQRQVNRIQPFEMVKEFSRWCRELKFASMNYDLIYGLPGQTRASFFDTVEKVIKLKPDRIALYSFAHVPWLKKHQGKLDEKALPIADEKLDIFLEARRQFLENGYQAIAMDHFALSTDEMSKAFNKGTLYRNFMGYTLKPSDDFLGFGMSAIGFIENTFIHNFKTIPDYYAPLQKNILPVEAGKVLSEDDSMRQWAINSLMCRFKLDKNEFKNVFARDFNEYFSFEAAHISQCISDGILTAQADTLIVTDLGKIFIRNVCMGFDWYLRQEKGHKKFSRTV